MLKLVPRLVLKRKKCVGGQASLGEVGKGEESKSEVRGACKMKAVEGNNCKMINYLSSAPLACIVVKYNILLISSGHVYY